MKATPPPNSHEVKVGRATYYVRQDVEELAQRLDAARRVEYERDVAESRHRLRAWALSAMLLGLALCAMLLAYHEAPQSPLAMGAAVSCWYLTCGLVARWWWRSARHAGR